MPTDATDLAALRERFEATVDYFNRGSFTDANFDQFGLDDSIKMKRIDDPPSSYHEGIDAVKKYFLTVGNTDKAKFIPDAGPSFGPSFQVVDGYGFVSGTAGFVDQTGSSPTLGRRIAYSFAYTSTSGQWKAIHLWGKYID